MMLATAMICLKLETDDSPLVDLAREVVAPSAALHLVSLVRVGKEGDEPQRLQAAKDRLGTLAAGLAADGYDVHPRAELCAIAPGIELARIATNLGVDLIVLGLGRRSRVGKALLGSDAQSVLLNVACPALVARTS